MTTKEKKVLASLYKIGDSTVAEVAKDTLINRTTLYPILEKLLSKGLISKISAEGRVVYQPISQEDFIQWTQRKEKEAQKQATSLSAWIHAQKKNDQPSLISDIKYFEGLEGVKSLYADTWRNNEEKLIYCITDYKSAYEKMGEFFEKEYFPERIKRGVHIKNILPESKIGHDKMKTAKEFLREMKFIKILEDLDIEINVYDNKVAIVAFDKIHPSGILIKNAKIASAMKNIFNYIWKKEK